MKFVIPLTALLMSAQAAPAVLSVDLDVRAAKISPDQCVKTITTQLGDLKTQADNLNKLAKQIQVNAIIPLLQLQAAATKITNTINDDAKAVKNCDTIPVQSVLNLFDPFNKLVPSVTGALSTIKSKKSVLDKAILWLVPASPLVKLDLQNLQKAITTYGNQLAAIVDPSAKQIVENLVKQITDPLASTISAF